MTAVDLSVNGGFAQLARAFVDIQAQEFLPLLPAAGVRDLRGALADTGALLLAGVPEEVLLRLVAWRPAPAGLLPRPAVSQLAQSPGGPGGAPAEQAAEEERQERPARGDIPVRRDGRRACKRTALQAALPENQVESLADLDGAILARSSEGPFRSRVRTWVDLTAAWALPAWPISLDSVRKVAASLRRGRYRSAQNYFDAAVTYQEHFRGESVDPLLRRALRRYAKAVVRGLAGSKLKAIFPAMRLEPLLDTSPASAAEPWNPFLVAHAADALLLAVWFMFREIEFAAARTEDIEAGEAWVLLRIPLRKTAQGGGRELTARQLRCACGVRSRPMCPAHAAMRHVSRLKVAGFWRRGGPLFPDAAGATWAKGETVMLFRRVLLAAGVTLTTVDHEGRLVQLFAGHAARVAGAAWLASKGVPTAMSSSCWVVGPRRRWSDTSRQRRWRWPRRSPAGSCRAAALAWRPPTRPGERPRAAWRPASQLRTGRGRRRCRPRLGSRWITLRRCNWSRPRRGVRGPGWATTRRRGRTSSTMRRGRRCTAPTRRRPALSRSSGGLGAARGRTASGASSGCLRSRRPQPGAPVVSRHRPVETVKVHRPSRWTPRWRPARRLSRTAPRLRKRSAAVEHWGAGGA